MKPTQRPLLRCLPLLLAAVLVLPAWAPADAAPRYADRDTALNLAQALDKGLYRNKLISSTFIRGEGDGRYIVRVVLDNGIEQDWDMHQIRQWSRDGDIVLRKNKALVFTSDEDNSFGILDKNVFVEQALASNVFVMQYPPGDILAGRRINYGVYRFNLAELLGLAQGRDRHGYRYQYVFDLANGERELLSAWGAYDLLARDGLRDDAPGAGFVEQQPYRLQAIRPRALVNDPEGGTARFGIDMVFDRPVMLTAEHYPYEFYENNAGAKARGMPEHNFVLEVNAPNAVVVKPTERIRTLEFLRDIHSVNDPHHQVRVLLRASVNPVVLTHPPRITVEGNTVRATFVKVVDQSVLDRQALRAEEARRKQAQLLAPTLTAEEVRREETYRLSMTTGRAQLDRAKRAGNFGEAFEMYRAALANFNEAAATAGNDTDLRAAMRERNVLLANLPLMVLEHAEMVISEGTVADPAGLNRLIDAAAEMTRDDRLLRALRTLQQRLPAPAGSGGS